MAKVARSEDFTTPICLVSFVNIFTPKKSQDTDKEYFEITILFDKASKAHMGFLKTLKVAADKVLLEQWPNAADRPRTPTIGHDKSLVKDGDTGCNGKGIPFVEKMPYLEGHYFMRLSKPADSPYPVIIVNQAGKPDSTLNASVIHAGAWCRASFNMYARTNPTNPGVSAGLNGVQYVKDGPSIGGGGPSAEEMFTPIEGMESADPFGDDVLS